MHLRHGRGAAEGFTKGFLCIAATFYYLLQKRSPRPHIPSRVFSLPSFNCERTSQRQMFERAAWLSNQIWLPLVGLPQFPSRKGLIGVNEVWQLSSFRQPEFPRPRSLWRGDELSAREAKIITKRRSSRALIRRDTAAQETAKKKTTKPQKTAFFRCCLFNNPVKCYNSFGRRSYQSSRTCYYTAYRPRQRKNPHTY